MTDETIRRSIYGPLNSAEDEAKILKEVSEELSNGIKILENCGKLISVFGSARMTPDDPYYSVTSRITAAIAKRGYAVLTGGGPGAMEAASKGAYENGGKTYGINVALPREQGMNSFVRIPFFCKYLFTRKVLLIKNSDGFVIMPGGYGTLDELFEVLTLIATEVIRPVPIVLACSEYWNGIYDWIKKGPLSKDYIDKNELNFIKIADEPEEIAALVTKERL